MRTQWIRFASFALVLILAVSFGANQAVRAQDAMMDQKVACDVDLIISLYIAEHNFDFAAVEAKSMAADTAGAMTHIDLTVYDKGQLAPFFDAMSAQMDSSMSMGMMDETTMNNVVAAMAMDPAQMMAMMPEATASAGAMAMTQLAPAKIEGEPAECTALRDELRHFYGVVAYTTMAAMMPQGS